MFLQKFPKFYVCSFRKVKSVLPVYWFDNTEIPWNRDPSFITDCLLEKLSSITQGTLELKHCPRGQLILHHLFSDYQYQTVHLDPVSHTF